MNIKSFFLIFALINFILFSFAEEPKLNGLKFEKCGTIRYKEFLMSKNPLLKKQITIDENLLQQTMNNSSGFRISNNVYTIPVVVHVVYFTNEQNISDEQVQSQIDVINEDFSRTNSDRLNTPQPFSSVASSTNFQFCLASQDPNGSPTNGIERRQTVVQVFQPDDDVKYFSTGGLNAWNVNKYLNIWVCNLGGDILGFGEAPSSIHSNAFGVVVQYNVFGRTGVLVAPYQHGRTCTHEISHCFDLIHIWGDENLCSGSDLIDDTPNQTEATFGCHSFSFTDDCTINYPGIMYMNYMDYSDDDCMNMFTKDQSTRMFTAINSFYPTLLTSTGCLSIGIQSISDFEFKIYPNPSSGILDFSTSKNIGSKATISITDILGKVVHESSLVNPNSFVHRIDLQELKDGIYFVNVFNEKYKRTEKISLVH